MRLPNTLQHGLAEKTHVSRLHLANHYVTALPLGYVFIGKCPS